MGSSCSQCSDNPQSNIICSQESIQIEKKIQQLNEAALETKYQSIKEISIKYKPQKVKDNDQSFLGDIDEKVEEKEIKGAVRKNHRVYNFQEDTCHTEKALPAFVRKKQSSKFSSKFSDSPQSLKIIRTSVFSHDKELSDKFICLHKYDSDGKSVKSILKNCQEKHTRKISLRDSSESKKVQFAKGTCFKKNNMKKSTHSVKIASKRSNS